MYVPTHPFSDLPIPPPYSTHSSHPTPKLTHTHTPPGGRVFYTNITQPALLLYADHDAAFLPQMFAVRASMAEGCRQSGDRLAARPTRQADRIPPASCPLVCR